MRRWKEISGILALAAALLVASPLASEATVRSAVADPGFDGECLVWTPRVDAYDRLVLSVFGPDDFALEREFPAGVSPRIELFGAGGFPLVDGLYKYELVAVPKMDDAVRQRLAAAREAGDDSVATKLRREGALTKPMARQSGTFRVRGGAFVPSDLMEPEPEAGGGLAADALMQGSPRPGGDLGTVVASNDAIVRNSLCVGFDCPNSPTFSDTTILMMENNTRIKFDDTSTTGGYPNNDWEIEANSNLSGGGNFFAVNDCGASSQGGCSDDPLLKIEAGAPSNSLYVDDSGRIGFGTSSPVVELHAVDGDTPTLRLDQDGSSGFAAQRWDVAGNETNFFVRDVTSGSKLPLRIRPNAPTSSIDVAGDGDVGIGTSSPDAALDVERNGSNAVVTLLRLTNTDGPQRLEFRDSSADAINWDFRTTSADAFVITQPTSPSNDFLINSAGSVTIRGSLTVGPGGCTGCDRVFQPGYEIESIEEHSASMWENHHLPGVGPTPEDQPMNLSRKTGGILNELEKAHIYIDQLHTQLRQKDAQIGDVNAQLAEVHARLSRLEALISGDATLTK